MPLPLRLSVVALAWLHATVPQELREPVPAQHVEGAARESALVLLAGLLQASCAVRQRPGAAAAARCAGQAALAI
jgi:hypothetical protein